MAAGIRRKKVVSMMTAALALILLAEASFPAAAITYTMTVKTDKAQYSASDTIMISGTITPAPTPNSTSAFIRVANPNGKVVAPSPANVGNNGAFSYSFGAGGTSDWISGVYTVNATWAVDATSKPISTKATFNYSPTATTTTTTSTSTTTTSTTTTSTRSTTTTTTTSRTTSSTTSSSTTSTTSTTSSTTIVPPTTTTTSASGGGGFPEFPPDLSIAILVTVGIVLAYAVARRSVRSNKGP